MELEESQLARLRRLSVGSTEELLGLIASNPKASADYLGVSDVSQIQSRAALRSARAIQAIDGLRDRRFALGALPPPATAPREPSEEANEEATQAAASSGFAGQNVVDLRAQFGSVRNQGDRGTCVAHAVSAIFECELLRGGRGPVDVSEQFLYYRAKEVDGIPDQGGTFIEVAAGQCLAQTGECLETFWPYNSTQIDGDEGQGPPPEGAAEDASTRRANGGERTSTSVDDLKSALDQAHPVAISVPVYDNWYSNPSTHLYGFIPLPLPFSELKGGHAMAAVGYGSDPDFAGGGYFILRNSWGTAWAALSPIEAGYGTIPFAYMAGYGWEAWTVTPI